MYDTGCLDMQHFVARHFFFVLTRVFARFQQFCTLEASLQIFWNSTGSLSQTLYWAQLTEDIKKYEHPPLFRHRSHAHYGNKRKWHTRTPLIPLAKYKIKCYLFLNEHIAKPDRTRITTLPVWDVIQNPQTRTRGTRDNNKTLVTTEP